MATATAIEPNELVKQMVKQVSTIATLPEVTAQIIKTVEDPKSTAQQLHKIVSHDPALVTRILKVVNSAFYGLPAVDPRGHKVARHYGAPEVAGPDGVDRAVTDADEAPVRAFLRAHDPVVDLGEQRGRVLVHPPHPARPAGRPHAASLGGG